MGLFSRERFGVLNVFVAVDQAAFVAMQNACSAAETRIVEADGDFAIASAEMARICRTLLDQQAHITHAAHGGEDFKSEEDAAAFGAECFADLSTRYLASADEDGHATQRGEAQPGDKRLVAMLTVAWKGSEPALEADVASLDDLRRCLLGIIALHERDALLLAHIHHSPAHAQDVLSDDQMLLNFPELMSL